MKKILSLIVVAVMALSVLTACSKPADEASLQKIALGASAYSIEVDASFQEGEITTEDTDESQIAYYFSEETKVDFDVYQWVKATDETLADAAADEAAEYDAEVSENTFNGNQVLSYNAVEEYEGEEYDTVTYLMEDGDNIVELVFWLDGKKAQSEVDAMMATLVKAEEVASAQDANTIVLGSSALSITTEKLYQKGDISEEDTDENQVAYYHSEDSLLDFDVYQWAKATDETLADAAADEVTEYDNAEITESTINGIQVLSYNAVEEYEGEEYDTVTYMMEDGDNIVELVFWLDGDTAQAEMDAIMATLTK